MRHLLAGAAMAGALALVGCEGMAPGGYGDMPEDPQIAAAGAAIPQLPNQPNMPPMPTMPKPPSTSFPATPAPPATGGPSQMQKPQTAPPPTTGQTTGGPSQMPKPPAANPPPAQTGGCSPPNIVLRTEVTGAVEIKCGTPPGTPPASLKCTAPEHVTYLTRNGASSFVCMK